MVVIVHYFQIWNKKEHNIIINRITSCHMGPMYIETLIDTRAYNPKDVREKCRLKLEQYSAMHRKKNVDPYSAIELFLCFIVWFGFMAHQPL